MRLINALLTGLFIFILFVVTVVALLSLLSKPQPTPSHRDPRLGYDEPVGGCGAYFCADITKPTFVLHEIISDSTYAFKVLQP